MIVKPLFHEVMTVQKVKEPQRGQEIKSLRKFYTRPFKVEELTRLFQLEVEQRPNGQRNIIYNDKMLIFKTDRRFLVLHRVEDKPRFGLPPHSGAVTGPFRPLRSRRDEKWGRENRQPYPETISDFIDSCWSLNVELRLTVRGQDELKGVTLEELKERVNECAKTCYIRSFFPERCRLEGRERWYLKHPFELEAAYYFDSELEAYRRFYELLVERGLTER